MTDQLIKIRDLVNYVSKNNEKPFLDTSRFIKELEDARLKFDDFASKLDLNELNEICEYFQCSNIINREKSLVSKILLIILVDWYFDTYFNTVLTFPNMKKDIWHYLNSIEVSYEEYANVSKLWRCNDIDVI